MLKKFKLFSRVRTNILEHPKLTHNKLKKRKWAKLRNSTPQRSSEYGTLLEAKQLLRAFYGNCSEKQFSTLYKKAKLTKGNTLVNFLKLMESRLDTVLFRLRFANTFETVRQYIAHKHIKINGKEVNSSSYILNSGDLISVTEQSHEYIKKEILYSFEQYLNLDKNPDELKDMDIDDLHAKYKLLLAPDHLDVNYNTLEGIFIHSPQINHIIYPTKVDLQSVIQYYEYHRKI